jgi:hypothetical protein
MQIAAHMWDLPRTEKYNKPAPIGARFGNGSDHRTNEGIAPRWGCLEIL